MRNAAGELADRFHLLRLAQLPFQLAAALFGGVALGDVTQVADEDVSIGHSRHADGDLHGKFGAVGT